MSTELLVILAAMVGLFGLLYVLMQRMMSQQKQTKDMEDLVNQIYGMTAQKFAEQNKMLLSSEKEIIQVDLENKQKTIESLIKQLQEDMKLRQQEIRLVEQDRVNKFTELHTELRNQKESTEQLKISTQQLASVLSNNQMRGEWGERIIEDLMINNGLVEGVHYLKQQTQSEGGLRPDITLILPNQRNVPVDVKFPYSAIQKMALAEKGADKNVHLKQFVSDVKTKIDKVSQYIDPANNTLDYAILFVPNEMVFSYINQKFPELVDLALAKRVLLVSPFTFLVVARTIMESYRNFMLSDRLREVVQAVDEFTKEWGIFRDKFEKYGRSLNTLKVDYDDLTGTRVRQMERKITKIGQLQHGSQITEIEEVTTAEIESKT